VDSSTHSIFFRSIFCAAVAISASLSVKATQNRHVV
jgi:hypothetical protein